ncbi:condensin subunit ScpA [Sesbania bispinosa]|nr:condensin subunit ScpA [Sesbania bispinosa]
MRIKGFLASSKVEKAKKDLLSFPEKEAHVLGEETQRDDTLKGATIQLEIDVEDSGHIHITDRTLIDRVL